MASLQPVTSQFDVLLLWCASIKFLFVHSLIPVTAKYIKLEKTVRECNSKVQLDGAVGNRLMRLCSLYQTLELLTGRNIYLSPFVKLTEYKLDVTKTKMGSIRFWIQVTGKCPTGLWLDELYFPVLSLCRIMQWWIFSADSPVSLSCMTSYNLADSHTQVCGPLFDLLFSCNVFSVCLGVGKCDKHVICNQTARNFVAYGLMSDHFLLKFGMLLLFTCRMKIVRRIYLVQKPRTLVSKGWNFFPAYLQNIPSREPFLTVPERLLSETTKVLVLQWTTCNLFCIHFSWTWKKTSAKSH